MKAIIEFQGFTMFIDLREHRPLIKNTHLFYFLIIKLQLAIDSATGASKFQQWLIECDFYKIFFLWDLRTF